MKNLKILLVEDDLILLKVTESKLKAAGCDVEAVRNGEEAADLISSRYFDVVITDLMMPGNINGIELLEAAKALDNNVEVILITGHGSINNAVTAMKKGAADYLQKPVNFEELRLRLEKIANLRSLIRDTSDLREAMNATENNASQTIRKLETMVLDLQQQLSDMKKTPDKRNLGPEQNR